MMLRTGDLNLNQFGGSMKEAVKRTMIQHEIIFKNQVRELHRLYWTQDNLMQELKRKELVANYCREIGTSQSQVSGNVGCIEESTKGKFVDMSSSRQRGFDLELPADDYVKNSICDVRLICGPEMVNSTKNDIDEKGGSMRSVLDKGKSLFCYEVINLEEPMEVGSDVEAYRISMGGLKVPVGRDRVNGSDFASSSRVQNEFGYLPLLNNLHVVCSEQSREQKSDDSASVRSGSAAAVTDRSIDSAHKQDPSSKPMLIDLNISLDEDSSQAFNDPMLLFPSPSSSSSVVQNELLWRGQVNQWQKETSGTQLLTTTENNTAWLSPDCQDSQRSPASDISQKQEHEACDKSSAERLSTGSNGELSNSTKGKVYSSAGVIGLPEENGDISSSSQHFISHRDIKMQASIVMTSKDLQNKQANSEGSEEDTLSSGVVALHENQQGCGQAAGTECSSLEKSAEQNSGTTQLDYTCTGSSQQNETRAVVDAAEILANLYRAKSPSPLAQLDIEENGTDQPQYSSDSFEAMMLELPEVGSDDHLIKEWTSLTENVGGGDETGRVNKLRRGRCRVVRDFQKDILPGMITLSRHEICEDLYSIGYELRKSGSRKGYGGSWFLPVRSRCSRRYPVRRRL